MKSKRNIIYLAGFLASVPMALISYINSSFLGAYFDAYSVGAAYIVASLITILAFFEMPKIFSALGARRSSLVCAAGMFAAFLCMSQSTRGGVIFAAFLLYFVCSELFFVCLDIFVEEFSEQSVGRFRGLFLMTVNVAWVIAEIISSRTIERYSFTGIYFMSAIFMFAVTIIFAVSLYDFRDPEYVKVPPMATIRSFFSKKNLTLIYYINFILKFFYAWMIIYTPIYLNEYLGFGWDKIAVIFTFMLLPFVIFQFPAGAWSDKIGEKKMLALGFAVAAVSTAAIPLVGNASLWLWAAVLFATRVGAAVIEVMSESYFFKSVTEKNDDEIAFFRNTTPLSYIIAPALAVPLLAILPSFKSLFFVLAAVLLLGISFSLKLREVKQ